MNIGYHSNSRGLSPLLNVYVRLMPPLQAPDPVDEEIKPGEAPEMVAGVLR